MVCFVIFMLKKDGSALAVNRWTETAQPMDLLLN